jgi:hypothetical protein
MNRAYRVLRSMQLAFQGDRGPYDPFATNRRTMLYIVWWWWERKRVYKSPSDPVPMHLRAIEIALQWTVLFPVYWNIQRRCAAVCGKDVFFLDWAGEA